MKPSSGQPSPATKIFEIFLDAHAKGEDPSIEELIRLHPTHADELRALHANWLRVEAALVDDTVTVDNESVDGASAWEHFLEQLASRGPAHKKYDLRGEIGRGGMGVVHKVFDRDAKRVLAMKTLLNRDEGSASSESAARTIGRFLDEAQVTSQLDHPGVVPVHEIGLDARGNLYFTMKLVKGDTLRAVLEMLRLGSTTWTITRTISILLRVCEAMSYAHAKGVLHRDLKPANIMVGRYGEVFVMDWGLARVLGRKDSRDLRIRPSNTESIIRTERRDTAAQTPDSPLITMDGDVVGTPAYMSPEQANGLVEQIGPHSDIYSIGAILYEILAGNMPYAETTSRLSPRAILARVMHGSPPSPLDLNPSASPELVSVCQKAMARQVDQRYSTMDALAEDLRAYLEGRVVSAHDTGTVATLRKWVARNRSLAATIALSVATIIVITILSFRQLNTEVEKTKQESIDKSLALKEAQTANELAESRLEEKRRALQEKELALSEANESNQKAQSARDELANALKDRELALQRAETLLDEARVDEIQSLVVRPAIEVISNLDRLRSALEKAESLRKQIPGYRRVIAELMAQDAASGVDTDPRAENQAVLEMLARDFSEDVKTRQQVNSLLASTLCSISAYPVQVKQSKRSQSSDRADVPVPNNAIVARISQLVARIGNLDTGSLNSPLRILQLRFEQAERVSDALKELNRDKLPWGDLPPESSYDLYPLGLNKKTNLFEFWHIPSGTKPERDHKSGEYRVDGSTGIVFVLLNKGEVSIGNTVVQTSSNSILSFLQPKPPTSLLSHFLISKYELTQGQWSRLGGLNGSRFAAAANEASTMNGSHPVESVSRKNAELVLASYSLKLPTEAQWEYACRAGNPSLYWNDNSKNHGGSTVNIADRYAQAHGAPSTWVFEQSIDDGFLWHAPVGSFDPNDWGIHDMIGNVAEWCRDTFDVRAYSSSAEDGLRTSPYSSNQGTVRGGSFLSTKNEATSIDRVQKSIDSESADVGIRVVRSIP